MAGGERGDDAVVEAEPPTGVGGVPEHVVVAYPEAEPEVGQKRRDRFDRDGDALRVSGGAAGEEPAEFGGATDRDGVTAWVVRVGRGEQRREVVLSHRLSAGNDDCPRRRLRDVVAGVELVPLGEVGDD